MDASTLEAGRTAHDPDTKDEYDEDDNASNISSTDTLIASQQLAEQDRRSRSETLTTVLVVISWIVLSTSTIIFNKYVIDNRRFSFPITLTCWHQTFAACMTQILARTTTWLDGRKQVKMNGKTYLRAIVPIGILYSGSLVSSNLPYLTLSVAFIQMLKSLGPAAVLLATCSLGLATADLWTCLNIVVIVLGTVAASFGEIKFVLSGFLYQIGGLFFEAYRLALIQRLLSSDQKMDPLLSLYYYAPICAVMIAVIAMIGEGAFLSWDRVLLAGPTILLANASVAFLLNVSSVMLIGKTSSLVLTLCGVLKNILVVALAILIWGTVVTPLQIFGYALSSIGLLYYFLGAETIHRFVGSPFAGKRVPAERKSGRPHNRKKIAVICITAAAVGGGLAGAFAGYTVDWRDWDPRLYWYSATRLYDGGE